jgi:transposase
MDSFTQDDESQLRNLLQSSADAWNRGDLQGHVAIYDPSVTVMTNNGPRPTIEAIVKSFGNPLDFVLTAGQRHDVKQAPALLAGRRCEYVIADKGYDADRLLDLIDAMGAIPVIPACQNRTEPRFYDAHLYKERHLVECFINKIKWYRRLFSRFDKLAKHFLGFLSFVASLIWLR